MKNWMIITLCICLAVSVMACSRSNNSSTSTQQLSEANSKAETESEQNSEAEIDLSVPDTLEQQPEIQVLLHIKGEEDGSGAVVYDASIQEIIDYLHDLQSTDFQGEMQETYCVEVYITIGDTYEVYEITTDNGDKEMDGKVLARKTNLPEYVSNNNSTSEENYKWFWVDADIWNIIGQHLYLPFTYNDGEFISRPINR